MVSVKRIVIERAVELITILEDYYSDWLVTNRIHPTGGL